VSGVQKVAESLVPKPLKSSIYGRHGCVHGSMDQYAARLISEKVVIAGTTSAPQRNQSSQSGD